MEQKFKVLRNAEKEIYQDMNFNLRNILKNSAEFAENSHAWILLVGSDTWVGATVNKNTGDVNWINEMEAAYTNWAANQPDLEVSALYTEKFIPPQKKKLTELIVNQDDARLPFIRT